MSAISALGTWTSPCLGSSDSNLRRTTHIPISDNRGNESVKQFVKTVETGTSFPPFLSNITRTPSRPIGRSRALALAQSQGLGFRACADQQEAAGAGEGGGRDGGGLAGRVVAFTTPLQYATRFEKLLRDKGAEPLWCPTIATDQTEETRRELEAVLVRAFSGEFEVDGVAFTSRAGIRAIGEALGGKQLPWKEAKGDVTPFAVAALGKDAELLEELSLVGDSSRVSLVVPEISTPQALVEALGNGAGRKILCPVPRVEGLNEPPVVLQFLQELRRHGWDPVRVDSYVTRWLGGNCARPVVVMTPTGVRFKPIDALVFTSTSEIEGFLKSCVSLGFVASEALQIGSRRFLVACHGPVTALGAQRLGVEVDVVGKKFQSFAGVIGELDAEFRNVVKIQTL